MKYEEIEHILETYSLADIAEYNSITEADILLFLVEEDFVDLPPVKPLEFD